MKTGDHVYLDTNVVITILEHTVPLNRPQQQFIDALEKGQVTGISSHLTLAECLVKPMRESNQQAIEAVLQFLEHQEYIQLLPVSRDIFVKAAEIRAVSGTKLPDAIHLASAVAAGCDTFLSDDKGIRMPASVARVGFAEMNFD